jgi:hypothetical protein
LPACEAVSVHVPGATSVTVVPETVQTDAVVEAKLTASPEDAAATAVNGGPSILSAGAGKLMVWLACKTVKLWLTGAAAE